MNTAVIWLKNALRLNDNRVLIEALKSTNTETILPIYILNKNISDISNNRIKFLYESLIDLKSQLKHKFSSNLIILNGKPDEIFRKLLEDNSLSISEIFTDYSNRPNDVEYENSLLDILSEGNSANLHIISKVNTLTNIEEIVEQENFKPPKNMKDMEKLFSKIFPKDQNAFYSVDGVLEIPEITDKIKEILKKS